MPLLRTGIDLFDRLLQFCGNASDLTIFSPYIKAKPLENLLSGVGSCSTVVVRWEPKDLLTGASDLEVFDICSRKGIALYRNLRLHMKAFVDSYSRCILGSANISSRALNYTPNSIYNYELATEVDSLFPPDRLYLVNVIRNSVLITESLYQQIVSALEGQSIELPESDFDLQMPDQDKDFLLSSLPMSYDVQTFLAICAGEMARDDTEMNCAMHDAALYGIDLNGSSISQRDDVKANFFSHPFILAFIERVQQDGFIYFGAAKEWIHTNCTTVPLPRRWEITENIQILYRWLVDLGDGRFEVDVPYAHSQRLKVLH